MGSVMDFLGFHCAVNLINGSDFSKGGRHFLCVSSPCMIGGSSLVGHSNRNFLFNVGGSAMDPTTCRGKGGGRSVA